MEKHYWGARVSCPSNMMEEADVAGSPRAPSAPTIPSPTRSPHTPCVHPSLRPLPLLSSWEERVSQTPCSQHNVRASEACAFWVEPGRSVPLSAFSLSLVGVR